MYATKENLLVFAGKHLKELGAPSAQASAQATSASWTFKWQHDDKGSRHLAAREDSEIPFIGNVRNFPIRLTCDFTTNLAHIRCESRLDRCLRPTGVCAIFRADVDVVEKVFDLT